MAGKNTGSLLNEIKRNSSVIEPLMESTEEILLKVVKKGNHASLVFARDAKEFMVRWERCPQCGHRQLKIEEKKVE